MKDMNKPATDAQLKAFVRDVRNILPDDAEDGSTARLFLDYIDDLEASVITDTKTQD